MVVNVASRYNSSSCQMESGLKDLLEKQELNIPLGYFPSAFEFLRLARSYFPAGEVVDCRQICAYTLASDAVSSCPEFSGLKILGDNFNAELERFLIEAETLITELFGKSKQADKQGVLGSLSEEQIESYKKLHRFYESLSGITEREADAERIQSVFGETDADEDLVDPRVGKYSYRQ
jgi:hypothetical protein